MFKAKIIPKNRRAKNRVHEHGEVMELLTVQGDKILVQSINKTFNKGTEKWMGWFTCREADFEVIT